MNATPSTLTALAERLELWPIDRLRPYERNPADAQRRPGGADRGVDGRVRLHQPDPGRRGGRHSRRAWAADGGPAAGPGRGAGGPARASDAGAEAGLCDRRQSACPQRQGGTTTLLAEELAWLRDERFDLDLLGFDAGELEQLLAPAEGETSEAEDEVPEPPVEPISKPGDLWLLGDHRVLCGDATVLTDVERVLAGSLADMAWTDPPYNVDYGNSAKDKLAARIGGSSTMRSATASARSSRTPAPTS